LDTFQEVHGLKLGKCVLPLCLYHGDTVNPLGPIISAQRTLQELQDVNGSVAHYFASPWLTDVADIWFPQHYTAHKSQSTPGAKGSNLLPPNTNLNFGK
jgi:hypothetical protein